MRNPLLDAIAGPEGELDALLEVSSEAELRDMILKAIGTEPLPNRDQLAMLAAHKLTDRDLATTDACRKAANRCYVFADAMMRNSKGVT